MTTRQALRILDLADGATWEEIKQRYRKLALQFHPDKNLGSDADEEMAGINAAFHFLSEHVSRSPQNEVAPGETPSAPPSEITRFERRMPPPAPAAPASFLQLGILVLDGSGSMFDPCSDGTPKHQAVARELGGVVAMLKRSRNRNCYRLAAVAFSDSAKLIMPDESVVQIADTQMFDPVVGLGGGTQMATGLQSALAIANSFLNSKQAQELNGSVVVVLLSDGAAGDPSAALKVGDSLKGKSQVKICAAYFGQSPGENNSDVALLRALSSDPARDFTAAPTSDGLRKFFQASLTTMVATQAR